MDFQKEKHEYSTMLVDHGAITQEQSDSLGLFNNNIGLHSNSITSSLMDCINWGWQSWLKAKAVPDGFVLVSIDDLARAAQNIRELNSGEYYSEEVEENVCAIETMIEAQESK
jgi:hypothetical protein